MLPIADFFGLKKIRKDIQDIIDFTNIRTARVSMVLIMLMQLFSFIFSFFFAVQPESQNDYSSLIYHRIAYVILFLAAFQLFLYCTTHKPKEGGFSHKLLNLSILVFLITLSIFSIYITINDYIHKDQIFVFITFELFIACLFIIRPVISYSIIIIGFFTIFILMKKTVGTTTATNIGLPILGLTLLMVNGIQYWRYLRLSRYTIQIRMMAEQMKQISLSDALTNLKNRLALREDFPTYMERSVLIFISDIDDFKIYNDTHGHEYGDSILEQYANQLMTSFGIRNCYRYGGDEFLVIIPDYNLESFLEEVEYCKKSTKEKFHFSGGYTEGVIHSLEDLRTLINTADENLYKAKRKGKNQIIG